MYAKFKIFRSFLLDFLSGSRIFLCKEFWVNLPVTMFFGMMVYIDCCALHSSLKYQLIPLPSVIALNILCQKSQHCAQNVMLSRAQFHNLSKATVKIKQDHTDIIYKTTLLCIMFI